MQHPPTLLALLASLSLAATAAAQDLIALTRNTQSIHLGAYNTCTPQGLCPTTLPPQNPLLQYWPGGTAWDATTGSLWVTTGQSLERRQVNPCGPSTCAGQCPRSAPAAQVMGLDINEQGNQLWTLDDAGVVTRCANTCPPTVLGSFTPLPSIALNGTNAPTGIAIDEVNGLVFYAMSDFGGSGSTIHCAQLATPAVIFQVTPLTICFGTLVTGIAVHPGLRRLYVTNGREVQEWTYGYVASGPLVTFTAPGPCCALAPPGDPYIDISLRTRPAVPMGESCANGSCPTCPMVHVLRNQPLLGTNLQLGLDLAPAGVPVWCLLNFGSCVPSPPGPPPLCGPIYVPLGTPAATLGFVVTGNGTGCNASATLLQPLPGNPVFLGTPMSSQFVGICPPTGTTMSNCLSWVLQ